MTTLRFLTGSVEGRFVDQVGQVRAGKAGCPTSQDQEIDIVAQRNFFAVDPKDRFAALYVGSSYDYATIETAGAKEGGVEYVGTIGGGPPG